MSPRYDVSVRSFLRTSVVILSNPVYNCIVPSAQKQGQFGVTTHVCNERHIRKTLRHAEGENFSSKFRLLYARDKIPTILKKKNPHQNIFYIYEAAAISFAGNFNMHIVIKIHPVIHFPYFFFAFELLCSPYVIWVDPHLYTNPLPNPRNSIRPQEARPFCPFSFIFFL